METKTSNVDLSKLGGFTAIALSLDAIKDALFSEISSCTSGHLFLMIPENVVPSLQVKLSEPMLSKDLEIRITEVHRPDYRKKWIVKGNVIHFGGRDCFGMYKAWGLFDPETCSFEICNGFIERNSDNPDTTDN